ncbi:MAG: phosphatase PAP2 family protein [Termitinemataceae bacterium]|nr:MAG: phosphatase PAP2 family protein [Termitinemataceae bacterium]
MKKFFIVSPLSICRVIVFAALVCAALMLAAVFFDLALDKYLYSPQNLFAKIFASLALVPQCVLTILCPGMTAAALFVMRKNIKPVYSLALIVLALVFVYPNTKYLDREICEKMGLPIYAAPFLIIALMALCFFIALVFAKRNPQEMLKVALIGLCAIFFGEFILNTIKINWGRQRFFTMTDPDLQFTVWWAAQGRAASDNYKSFPSGHAFSSMLAIWFALFPCFLFTKETTHKMKCTLIIFSLALIFSLCSMLSRLILGKHFLSDVTAGAFLSLFSVCIFTIFIDWIFKRNSLKNFGNPA